MKQLQFIPYLRFIVDLLNVEMFDCNEKFRKLEFLMLFVNLALENERKMDLLMPIVKSTLFTQYQWEKCNTFLILDLSVDMPNVEMLALSQRPLVNIFSQISFTYAQGLSKRSTSVASLLRSPSNILLVGYVVIMNDT